MLKSMLEKQHMKLLNLITVLDILYLMKIAGAPTFLWEDDWGYDSENNIYYALFSPPLTLTCHDVIQVALFL